MHRLPRVLVATFSVGLLAACVDPSGLTSSQQQELREISVASDCFL